VNDVPPWYLIGTVGLAAAFGATLAAVWHGLWPFGDPNIFGFAALCAAVALVGVQDTFRSLTRQMMDPSLALVELIIGGALTLLLTQHLLPFFVALGLLGAVRGQAGRLTRLVVDLYDTGNAEAARRTRRSFTSVLLAMGVIVGACLVWSGLDRSAGLLHWTTAPIVLLAGVCGLVLVSGAEYEVMRSRFRGGEVTTDAAFGVGWWGPVAGLIAAVVLLAALVPPLPSVVTLQTVGHDVVQVSERTVPNTGPQNVAASTQPQKPGPIAKVLPRRVRQNAGLYIFLLFLLVLVVTLLVRSVRYARRLGLDAAQIIAQYWLRGVETARSAAAFFTGLYALLVQGFRDGDWRGMARFGRRWWNWLLELLSGALTRNIWRQLGIRSSAHRAGAEFAAAAGPRTIAGAAWNLPPDDPRRRVRELYRRFMQEASEAGLARRAWQTPRAYQLAVQAAEPGTAEGLGDLTGAYEHARFSPHPVGGEVIVRASGGWERISAFLLRRRERDRALAGQGGEGARGRRVDAGVAAEGKSVQIRRGAPRRGT